MIEYQKQKEYYNLESKDYDLNSECKSNLYLIISKELSLSNEQTSMLSNFEHLTYEMVNGNKSTLRLAELKSFVKVRSNPTIRNGKRTFKKIPTLKEDLLQKVDVVADEPVKPRYYRSHPTVPVSDITNRDTNSTTELEMGDGNISNGSFGDDQMDTSS